jgi:Putative zinc-finger
MVVNCEKVWSEISNYIDGDVDAALRSALDEHFQSCRKCASVLAGTRNVIQLYGDERMLEVPEGFSRRLEKRIAQDVAVKRTRWATWATWLIPVAAMALIASGLKLTNMFTFRRPVRSILAVPANNIPPDLQVLVADGSRLFHVPGCDLIRNKTSLRKMTAKEAIEQGYAPCSRCLKQYLKTQIIRPRDQDSDSEAGESASTVRGELNP